MKPRGWARWGYRFLAFIVIAWSVFPVYWMIQTAFTPNGAIGSTNNDRRPRLFPENPTWENFKTALFENNVEEYLWNSIIVAVSTVVIGIGIAFLAAVAAARFRFKGRTSFLVMLIVAQMIPLEAMVIPVYVLLRDADMLDQLPSLIGIYLVFVLPFSIWTLHSFIKNIPVELEEAAMVDGASRTQAFWKVLFPLVAPGLVATSVFATIQAWNEYIFALQIMEGGNYTLPVWLGSFTGREGMDWGGLMAGSTLFTIPIIIFFVLVQRRITAGLAAGAVKG